MRFRSILLATIPALLVAGTVACGALPGLGPLPAGPTPSGAASARADSPGSLSAQQRIDAWKSTLRAEQRDQVSVETHGRFLIARFATPATPSEDGMSFTPGSVEGVVATDYDTLPFSWVCGDFPSGTVDFDGDGTEDLLMVVYDPTTSSACMGKDVSALQVIVTQGGKLKALEVARNLGICEVGLAPGGEKGEKPFVGARCEEGGGAKDLSFEWDGKAIVRAAGPTERNTQTGAKAPASYQCELRFHCTWMPTKDAAPEPEWEVWSIEVENGAIRAVTFTPACPARDPSMWKVDSDGTPVDGTWKTAKLAPMEPGAKKPKSPARELKHRLTAGKLELDTRDGPKICEPQ